MANQQLQDVQKVPYSFVALDADQNATSLAAGSTLAVDTTDHDSGTVAPDATAAPGTVASGFLVGGAKLGTIQLVATETKADGTTGLTGAVSVDIVAGDAASLAPAFGTPVAQ